MSGPTLTEVAKQANDLTISANIVWTLLTGFLVMFMQAGFALVETGLDSRQERRTHDGDEFPGLRASASSASGSVGFAFRWAASARSSTFGGDATLANEFTVTIGWQRLRAVRHRRASS